MTCEEIFLETDVSNLALELSLSQLLNGQERVISYAGKTTNKAETNFHVIDKEL